MYDSWLNSLQVLQVSWEIKEKYIESNFLLGLALESPWYQIFSCERSSTQRGMKFWCSSMRSLLGCPWYSSLLSSRLLQQGRDVRGSLEARWCCISWCPALTLPAHLRSRASKAVLLLHYHHSSTVPCSAHWLLSTPFQGTQLPHTIFDICRQIKVKTNERVAASRSPQQI